MAEEIGREPGKTCRTTGLLYIGTGSGKNDLKKIAAHARRIQRALIAWCGQNSLHWKQEQQRWLFSG